MRATRELLTGAFKNNLLMSWPRAASAYNRRQHLGATFSLSFSVPPTYIWLVTTKTATATGPRRMPMIHPTSRDSTPPYFFLKLFSELCLIGCFEMRFSNKRCYIGLEKRFREQVV